MNINQIINTALQIEIANIEADNIVTNPYYDAIIQMNNGEALWEVFNILVESHFRHVERYNKLESFADKVCAAHDDMQHTIDTQAAEIERLRALVDDLRDEIVYLNDIIYTY